MDLEMRRKDRAMDEEFGLRLIDRCEYGILSMVDNNEAYSVPLSIVRDGRTLYFHSAKAGRKVSLLDKGPDVNVVFVGETKIPENFTKEELEEYMDKEETIGRYISSVFTTEFESVMVFGKVKRLENREEKIKALRLICEKYTEDKMKYFDLAVRVSLDRLNIYSISMDRITSKRKKYDQDGIEMKWGREK